MTKSSSFRSLLRPVSTTWSTGASTSLRSRLQPRRCQHAQADGSHLPRIVQPSTWDSIFPRSLRESAKSALNPFQRRNINPATYFIWIYVLIGSQAIRILSIQNEHATYMRKAELQIEKLREVVKKLQRGEPVDVEKVLGTGNEEQEQEWDEALKEIENEERAWRANKRKREQEVEKTEAEKQDANPVSSSESKFGMVSDLPDTLPRPAPTEPAAPAAPGFY